MITASILRNILKQIYGIEDKYLVPISTNWYVPTTDPKDKVGTWIGYRILNKKAYARAWQPDRHICKPISVTFRMTFVGPQAEEFADQTLLWEERADIIKAFEKYQTQLNYNSREAFTYPVRNGGYNDDQCWIVDFKAQTIYDVDTKQLLWIQN